MTKKKTTTTRGTDEAFWQLMEVGGSSILKLLGVSPEEAEKYCFRAVALKEKRLEPDIEGVPILEGEGGRVFIEFQGYHDKFIRYRLIAEVLQSCWHEQYEGKVFAGIVYTDKKYKNYALSLNNAFTEANECQLKGSFREIVLTDYTEEALLAIDPKLVVLAPFTLSSKTDKSTLLVKGQEWSESVTQVFPAGQEQEALNILGLFVLNRFRKMSEKEVLAMLHFDLMDTVAGRQLSDRSYQKGSIETARQMVIENLEERFGIVPGDIIDQIRAIIHQDVLKSLLRQAIRCPEIDSFNKMLLKATK